MIASGGEQLHAAAAVVIVNTRLGRRGHRPDGGRQTFMLPFAVVALLLLLLLLVVLLQVLAQLVSITKTIGNDSFTIHT